jgi:integrase
MGKTKSRANGDGDVFPRKNKDGKITSYRGVYFGPDGKRRYVSGKTKEEARKALREARSGADQGLVFDAGMLTVAEYLDRWLKDSVRGSVRRSTYESYGRQARRYIIPAVGRMRLKALTPAHVQDSTGRGRIAGSPHGPSSTRTPSCTGRSSRQCGGAWFRTTCATP